MNSNIKKKKKAAFWKRENFTYCSRKLEAIISFITPTVPPHTHRSVFSCGLLRSPICIPNLVCPQLQACQDLHGEANWALIHLALDGYLQTGIKEANLREFPFLFLRQHRVCSNGGQIKLSVLLTAYVIRPKGNLS